VLFPIVIDKREIAATYQQAHTLYRFAMQIGLEKIFSHLKSQGEENKTTCVVVEKRGAKEDKELETAFYHASLSEDGMDKPMPFEIVMVAKTANSAGLQVADLMARPIGIHHLRPKQPNRAYEIVAEKIYK
jgi:hypothetical protein